MKKLIPLLLLLVVFAAGCDLTGLTVTTSSQAPVISSFDVDTSTIAAGESSTLSWSVVGATTVRSAITVCWQAGCQLFHR